MRRCGYVVTSLPGAVLLTVLTCLEQVTNDGRSITTRKLWGPSFVPPPPPARFSDCNTNVLVQSWWIIRLTVKTGNLLLVSLLFERADI